MPLLPTTSTASPSFGRRIGRSEQTHLVLSDMMIRKNSHDLDVLMGILIEDGNKESSEDNQQQASSNSGSLRKRKQGKTVQNPLSMINKQGGGEAQQQQKDSTMENKKNISKSQESVRASTSANRNAMKRNGSSSSLLPLKRAGSVTSSIMSRKSSSRSIGSNRSKGTDKSRTTNHSYSTNRTNGTLTSQSSYVKTNSGNFDGGNNRRHHRSSNRKSSAASRREQIIAEFYRDLEELDEERSSSDSSDDDKDDDDDDDNDDDDDEFSKNKKTNNNTMKKNKTKKLKKGKIEVEELKSHQRVEEYLMRLEQPDPTTDDPDAADRCFDDDIIEEDEGIRSDMSSDARYGSSFNSSYSSDAPMMHASSALTHYRSEPKYIKKPNPPQPKMIAELDASPGTSNRYKIRGDHRVLTTDNNGQYDINENSLDKYDKYINHRSKRNNNNSRDATYLNRDSPNSRQLPKHPKEVQLIDKTLLRDSFNNKNSRKQQQQQQQQQTTIDTLTSSPTNRTRRNNPYNNNKDNFMYMVDSDSDSSCSTDSAHGSDRSMSSVSSISISRPQHINSIRNGSHNRQQQQQQQQQKHNQIHKITSSSSSAYRGPVPKNNFIPGQSRKSAAVSSSSKHHSISVTAATSVPVKGRKVSFCFRGVPFRVYNNTPRTHRALAHAGCIALIIPSPENHKCNH